MAIFEQFKRTENFTSAWNIPLEGRLVKLGISIGEKDYMKWSIPAEKSSDGISHGIPFIIQYSNTNIARIEIGKTFIYEPGDFITIASLSFPEGAPPSTLVDITYKSNTTN